MKFDGKMKESLVIFFFGGPLVQPVRLKGTR